MSRNDEPVAQRGCIADPRLVAKKGKKMKGRKMGHRKLVLHSEYFPALCIFLSASYPAFDRRGGNTIRVSRGVVLPIAISVIELGRNM